MEGCLIYWNPRSPTHQWPFHPLYRSWSWHARIVDWLTYDDVESECSRPSWLIFGTKVRRRLVIHLISVRPPTVSPFPQCAIIFLGVLFISFGSGHLFHMLRLVSAVSPKLDPDFPPRHYLYWRWIPVFIRFLIFRTLLHRVYARPGWPMCSLSVRIFHILLIRVWWACRSRLVAVWCWISGSSWGAGSPPIMGSNLIVFSRAILFSGLFIKRVCFVLGRSNGIVQGCFLLLHVDQALFSSDSDSMSYVHDLLQASLIWFCFFLFSYLFSLLSWIWCCIIFSAGSFHCIQGWSRGYVFILSVMLMAMNIELLLFRSVFWMYLVYGVFSLFL